LLRRLVDEGQARGINVGRPIRQKRHELVQEASLRKAVKLALLQNDCCAVLILFDGDDDCPAEVAPALQTWAQSEAGAIPVAVVIARREYEAWFLASMESLRGTRGILQNATSHPTPEEPRDAKGQLEERMGPGSSYHPATDQAALTERFDLASAHARCRSFRRMVKAFGVLAAGMGVAMANWPPPTWEAGV
jgi:hypothetical protein